jgi:hypothetical protein
LNLRIVLSEPKVSATKIEFDFRADAPDFLVVADGRRITPSSARHETMLKSTHEARDPD